MKLYQALEISTYVRRIGWTNPKYYLIFGTGSITNSTGINDYLTPNVLGIIGQLADDWVALNPIDSKDIYTVDGRDFEVISLPLNNDKKDEDEDY